MYALITLRKSNNRIEIKLDNKKLKSCITKKELKKTYVSKCFITTKKMLMSLMASTNVWTFFLILFLWSFNVWGYLWLGLFRSPSACVPKRGTAVVRPHCSCQHYSVHLSRNIGYLASCNRLVTWVVEVVVVGCSMKLLLLFNLLLQKGGGS